MMKLCLPNLALNCALKENLYFKPTGGYNELIMKRNETHKQNCANGFVHNKMNHIQFMCSFQKGKDLKLEIEMACNYCTKFMV
jgi:hypothetical protein